MLGRRGREEFEAGRAAVRAAAARGGATIAPTSDAGAACQEAGDNAEPAPASRSDAAEVESLRALLAELHELAELSQARIAELETQLTAAHYRADRFGDVLELQGVRRTLRRLTHPDAHPGANEEQLRALNEASRKLNAAYELLDRAGEQKREASPMNGSSLGEVIGLLLAGPFVAVADCSNSSNTCRPASRN